MPPPPAPDVTALIDALLAARGGPARDAPNVAALDEMLGAIAASLRADFPTPSAAPVPLASAPPPPLSSAPQPPSSHLARLPLPAAASTLAAPGAPYPAQTPARTPRKKRYADAAPSTHCHVCCRLTGQVEVMVCSNIRDGTCRKVLCRKCFDDHGWDWAAAMAAPDRWVCPHCVDECSRVRAHCWVYRKTNTRRRIKGLRGRARRGAGPPTHPSAGQPRAHPPPPPRPPE